MNKRAQRISVLFAAGMIATAFALNAQAPPALPELASKRLLNDLQIIVARMPQPAEEMTIGWLLRYGAAFDPAGKSGLAWVASQMLGRATLDRSAKNIRDELDLLQARLEVQCDWDRIAILLHTRGAWFERALLLLYQIVGEAVFLQEDLDRVKAERLSRLGEPEDPRQAVRSSFERELFSGTTYGRPMRGTAETMGNIALGDLRNFYDRFFSPNEAALVIVGSMQAEAILPKATRIWGVWVRKEPVPFTFLPPRPPVSRRAILEDDPQSPAAQFILGSIWPRRGETVDYAARIAARVLEERLTRALPTSLLTVGTEGRRMNGPFYVQGQAAAERAVEEIQKILETIDALKASGCTQQELEAAQTRWIEEFYAGLGSSEGVCRALMDAELYRLGTNYLAVFDDVVRRTDLDAVKQAAKEWLLRDGMLLLVRGPAASLREGLASMGVSLRESAP
jgi:zinc protease